MSEITVASVVVGDDILHGAYVPCDPIACRAKCCRFGAILDSSQLEQIVALLPRLMPLLRKEARAAIRRFGVAFKGLVREKYRDSDKPMHALRVADGFCIFLIDPERGCALHRLALEDGVPVTRYKPLECYLFPLNDVTGGALKVHRWKGYPCTKTTPQGIPALTLFQAELSLLLTPEGYGDLCDWAQTSSSSVGLPSAPDEPGPVPRGRPRRAKPSPTK